MTRGAGEAQGKPRANDLASRTRRKSSDARPGTPHLPAVDDASGQPSCATAVAAEALRTGVVPHAGRRRPARGDPARGRDTILVGDPDDDVIANEYAGEDTPGGSSTTPDQNDVDAIGRAYGLQEEDAGALRCASEMLDRRDRHRPELTPPRRRV